MNFATGDYSSGDDNPVDDSGFHEDLPEIDSGGTSKQWDGEEDGPLKPQARGSWSCSGEDSGCDCLEEIEGESDWDDGFGSDRSYNGTDADINHGLKEYHRQDIRVRKVTRTELELERENEVRAVHPQSAQQPQNVKVLRALFLDYVEHLWKEYFQCIRRLDIDVFDERFVETISQNQNTDLLGEVHGQVYLDDGTFCSFGPFEPPRFAARETFTYKAKGQYDISIIFVSNPTWRSCSHETLPPAKSPGLCRSQLPRF